MTNRSDAVLALQLADLRRTRTEPSPGDYSESFARQREVRRCSTAHGPAEGVREIVLPRGPSPHDHAVVTRERTSLAKPASDCMHGAARRVLDELIPLTRSCVYVPQIVQFRRTPKRSDAADQCQ